MSAISYLELCASALAGTDVALGAQNVSPYPDGAHTGEVSTAMLREFGCRYVLIGHSERRAGQGDDDVVARKVQRAIEEGLRPVPVSEKRGNSEGMGVPTRYRHGRSGTASVGLTPEQLRNMVVAYEPEWAIGTGNDRHTSHGGSMKPANAGDLLAMPDIDGGLIGGASLDAPQFLSIV